MSEFVEATSEFVEATFFFFFYFLILLLRFSGLPELRSINFKKQIDYGIILQENSEKEPTKSTCSL